jgi:hypothetical protein
MSILFCANMDDSDKCNPLIIWKSETPRVLKNVNKDNLPVIWRSNANAWMTAEIFKAWLLNFDLCMKTNRKIIRFLDNFSGDIKACANISLSNIVIRFFPPNSTSLVQPLDQGVIKNFKHYYRAILASRYIDNIDNEIGQQDIDVKDAIYYIDESWHKVKSATVSNCLRVCDFNTSLTRSYRIAK